MRFYTKVSIYTIAIVILAITTNFIALFFHKRAINNLIDNHQNALANNGITTSYKKVNFSGLAAWDLKADISEVELYIINPKIKYLAKIDNLYIASNILKGNFNIYVPSQIDSNLKTQNKEYNVYFNFVDPSVLSSKIKINLFNKNNFYQIEEVKYYAKELIIREGNTSLIQIDSINLLIQYPNLKKTDLTFTLNKAKVNRDYNIFREYTQYIDQANECSIIAKISSELMDKKQSNNKPEEKDKLNNTKDKNDLFNYLIKQMKVDAGFFTVNIQGSYSSTNNSIHQADLAVNIRNYNNLIVFYIDLINNIIKNLGRLDYVLTKTQEDSIKSFIKDLFKPMNDNIDIDIIRKEEKDPITVSGFTLEEISEKIKQTLNKENKHPKS